MKTGIKQNTLASLYLVDDFFLYHILVYNSLMNVCTPGGFCLIIKIWKQGYKIEV